jgi:hypothetical protein
MERLGILPSGTQSVMGTPLHPSSQPVPQVALREPAFTPSPSILQPSSSTISEDTGSRIGIILLAVFGVLVLCAAAAAVGFLLFMR